MSRAVGAPDRRQSLDSLAAVVQRPCHWDPCRAALLVLCNRDRNKRKILEWADPGFGLHDFRRERGRLAGPMTATTSPQTVTRRPLQGLRDGLPLEQPTASRPLRPRRMV